jgi:chromosome partitioning protein
MDYRGTQFMSAIVVGFISEKGGVGKTTCCYHIAVALQRFHKKKVLIVDTDYQRGGITCRLVPSMLEHFKQGKVPHKTLYSVFRALYSDLDLEDYPIPEILKSTNYNLSLIPSDPRLTVVTVDKLPGTNLYERNLKHYDHMSAISRALEHYKTEYDYILIDTHPEISHLLESVIFASDFCVSPVKLDQQSSVGVPSAIEAINQVNRDRQVLAETLKLPVTSATTFAGAIGMMAREYDGDLIYTMKQQYVRLKKTDSIFKNYVTEGDGLRAAAEHSIAVYDCDGQNAEKQSLQFRAITNEFIARCK